jgi:prevent-host-death family protein
MPVSKFKATCLAVLERVKRTGRPILITRYGKAVAEVVPPSPPAARADWLGAMRGRAEFVGDVIEPAGGPRARVALRK